MDVKNKIKSKKSSKKQVLKESEIEIYKRHILEKEYEWIEYLGTGNWGEVYKIKHKKLDCYRAIKILLPKYLVDSKIRNNFLNEAKKMAKLKHNHIVNITDFGSPKNKPYYIMEYVESKNFKDFLESYVDLKRGELLEILIQLCDVLIFIHENKFIHMDIKSENVLIDRNLSAAGIKLADFGLAINMLSSSSQYLDTDQSWLPKSLREKLGKKVRSNTFKPAHDLAYLGRMLEKIGFIEYTNNVWSERQNYILEKIIKDLNNEVFENATQLKKKLLKISPSHPPTAGIPELAALHAFDSDTSIRIPPNTIVPTTKRIIKLIELPEFQRLRRIKQLGPTNLIYPGADHSRFEHSLGAYSLAVEYLNNLIGNPYFDYLYENKDLKTLLVSVLLHDIGHYPFAHQLEELNNSLFPLHRDITCSLITDKLKLRDRMPLVPLLKDVLNNKFDISPDEVAKLIKITYKTPRCSNTQKILASFLNSAIDVDKLDYLMRDSIHCGVEYGLHIDKNRLLRSLTISKNKNELAVTEKGKIAAEYMIIGRSAMFSEVYWHHTNRAATTMIKRGVEELLNKFRKSKIIINKDEFIEENLTRSDEEFIKYLIQEGPDYIQDLIPGLPPWSMRQVYKRVLTYARYYDGYKARIFNGLIKINRNKKRYIESAIVKLLNKKHPSLNVANHEIIIDIPSGDESLPPVQIVYPSSEREVSLDTITNFDTNIFDQFFKQTKKARVFCIPRIKEKINSDLPDIEHTIAGYIDVAITDDEIK